MPKQPIWADKTRERVSFQPLATAREVEVAVIGAGITGLTTALRLADEGVRVAVLEAGQVGGGTTGYATGNLYAPVSQGLAKLRRQWNADVVRSVVQGRMDAIALIEETVKRLRIDCQFERCPWYLCASGAGELERLEAEHQAAAEAGLNARLEEAGPLPLAAQRVLRLDHQAQLNPYAYLLGLARGASGCEIFEHTRVTGLDPETGLVETDRAPVRARHIVLATHTPKGLNLIHTELGPFREYALAARLREPLAAQGTFWMLDELRSLRGYRYEDQDYLILVGEPHKTGEAEDSEDHFRALEAYLQRHFQPQSIDYRWSAQHYRPADGLPYIGRSGEPALYLATGYAADGLVYGTLAGMIISDQILGRDNRWSQLFDPHRFTPLKSAKRVVKENLHFAEHLIMDHLGGAEAGSVEEVAPGQGRIVRLNGEKLAVYRAPDNTLTVLSPVCPHLKCMVRWNTAETSWDCPCHGSRFRTDGSVIEGPALHGLEPRAPRH